MNFLNSWIRWLVVGPGLGDLVGFLSKRVMGTMSFVVTAMNSSSAWAACWGVRDFSRISRPMFWAAFRTYLRVIEGRMCGERGVVCNVRAVMAKNAEAAPSVI